MNRVTLAIIAAASLLWAGLGYAAWRAMPPLLFSATCNADGCDPLIGWIVRYGGPELRYFGIDALVDIAGSETASDEAVGRAWYELGVYRETDSDLLEPYFPGEPASYFYDNAATYGFDTERGLPPARKKWGETFGNWTAALTTDSGQSTCFITSLYDDELGGDISRGTNLTFFTRAPDWDVVQLQYNSDVTDEFAAPAVLRFSGAGQAVSVTMEERQGEHLMFGNRDPALTAAAMTAKHALITITPVGGEPFTDRIPLDGLAQAYADMENICGITLPDNPPSGGLASTD